jgi:hypothetical protein
MKISIFTISTLALFTNANFAKTKVNIPSKEAILIFKVAGFAKSKAWLGRKIRNG